MTIRTPIPRHWASGLDENTVTDPLFISAEQPNLLYKRIVVHLSGMDRPYLTVDDEDFNAADRIGHELTDELQLLMGHLGWGEASR